MRVAPCSRGRTSDNLKYFNDWHVWYLTFFTQITFLRNRHGSILGGSETGFLATSAPLSKSSLPCVCSVCSFFVYYFLSIVLFFAKKVMYPIFSVSMCVCVCVRGAEREQCSGHTLHQREREREKQIQGLWCGEDAVGARLQVEEEWQCRGT